MIFRLDFDHYVPVQHQLTKAYFAFRAADNKDFDAADGSETYLCYPLHENGALNTSAYYFILRKELQSIFFLL